MVGQSVKMRQIFGLIEDRPDGRVGHHPGRDRHRQGAGGARHPRAVARSKRARWWCSTAAPFRPTSSRASCSATRRAPSPARSAARPGAFERANGGTIFLDELGELRARPAAQAAARAGEPRGAARRRQRRHRGRRARHRRHQPRPGEGDRRRATSARTSTSASRSSTSSCRRCAQRRDDIPHIIKQALGGPGDGRRATAASALARRRCRC